MTIFRTFTDTERAALKLHGLDTHRPSQLADAFVLGMRHSSQERRDAISKACGEVFGWAPKDGVVVDHALPTTPVVDHGPWSARKLPTGLKWCVESDDFTHDVMLIIDGDFADDDSRKAYAEGIAAQLNAPGVPGTLNDQGEQR